MSDERDVVDGQDLIDELCWRFGPASNNSSENPSDPFADKRAGGDDVERPSHDEIGDELRESIEYDGDDPRDWDIPEDEPVDYHAILRARERSDELPTIANWELIGHAAGVAFAHDISREQLLEDLEAHPTPQYGFDESRARKEIRGVWRKAEAGNYQPPSRSRLVEKGILPDSWRNGGPSPPGLQYRQDGYYKLIRDNETGEVQKEIEITNCHFRTLSRLTHIDGEREFRIEVSPAAGEDYVVNVEPTVLNDKRKFREQVLVGWSATFDGSQEDLNAIKQFIAGQDAPARNGAKRIGLHGDEFVTPTGALRVDGWTDDPETVYTDEASQLNPLWQLDPEDGAEYDDDEVAEILRLMPQTRDPERFVPVLGWFYAAPLKPQIMDWEGEFNILNVLGDTGSGKTTTLETLWQMFGMEGELLAADTTGFTMLTAISSTNALPVIFDEYKPADMRDYTVDNLKKYIRLSTRGGIESKGSASLESNNYRLTAPICLSGEQPLQGPAEERRTILTTFTRDVISGATEETRAFQELIGGEFEDERFDGHDIEQHALAYYRWVLDQSSAELHELWYAARDRAAELLADAGITIADLDDMVMQGFQTVWFGITLYRAFADHVGLDAYEIVSERDLERSLMYLVDEGTGFEHVSHLDRLLSLMARAADAGYIEEGRHFTLVSPRNGPETELCIQLDSAFDQVRRYCRDHDVRESDILNSGDDYRPRLRDNEEQGRYVTNTSKTASYEELGRRRSIAFDLNALDAEVDDFSAGAFTADEVGAEEAKTLAAMEYGHGKDFTATVSSYNHGEYTREAQGKLTDGTSTIGFVIPGNNDDPLVAHQDDTMQFRNVTLRKDDSGLREAVIDDAAEVSVAAEGDDSGSVAARSDGGGTTDTRLTSLVAATVSSLETAEKGASHGDVIDELRDDHAAEEIDTAISTALREGKMREVAERTYRRD